jgi:hypothetical protein
MRRQRGAALLALVAVLCAITAAAAMAQLRQHSRSGQPLTAESRALALARDALRGQALLQRCADPGRPLETLLACPEAGGAEGQAAATCTGTSRGWLPWRSLGLPPLRDGSGTCLWMERDGLTARVVAPGPASTTQTRTADPARVVCPGNADPAQYLDPADRALILTLDVAALTVACP